MKFKSTILTILLAMLPLASFSQNKSEREKDAAFTNAVNIYNKGDYTAARQMFKAITAADGNYDACWYYMGQCDLGRKQYELACEEFKKAIAIDSTNYWYYDRLSYAYIYLNDYDAAALVCEKIIKKFPKKVSAFYRLLDLYLGDKKYDKAIMALDNVEASEGQNERTVLTRYQILMQQNKTAEAKEVLLKYNRDNLSLPVVSTLGDLEMMEYNDSLALKYYDEALGIDSEFAHALVGKAEIYRMKRKYDDYFNTLETFAGSASISAGEKHDYLDALFKGMDPRFFSMFESRMDSVMNKALTLHPKDSSIIINAVQFNYKLNRKDKAIDLARDYMKSASEKNSSAVILLTSLLQDSKRWQECINVLDTALVKEPANPAYLYTKSTCCFQLGKYEDCAKCLETILDTSPVDTVDTPILLGSLGDVYWHMGDKKSCFKAYELALKLKPESDSNLNNYAYFLSESRMKLKKAEEMSHKVILRNPENATYLDTYAWILYLRGKAAEAKLYFKKAMMHGGKESKTILTHYVEVLKALGDNDLSQYYYNLAETKDE